MEGLAVCVERNRAYLGKLTVGKIYEVTDEGATKGLFVFTGDDNKSHSAYAYRFLLLSKLLEE